MDGDGTPDTIFATGPGDPAQIAVVSGADDATVLVPPTAVFDGFTGGAFVAAGDFDRDGRAEIVVTPDQGGGPRVTILSLLPTGLTQRANYFTLNPDFRGGVTVAVGLGADGRPTLTVGAGPGGGPRVRTFDAGSLAVLSDVFAFAPDFSGGVYVAAGDVLGTGTVSGPEPAARGCLLERTWGGTEPVTLPSGEQRRFLEDGDRVTLVAPGLAELDCAGVVLPASRPYAASGQP